MAFGKCNSYDKLIEFMDEKKYRNEVKYEKYS